MKKKKKKKTRGWVAPFGYPRINACSQFPLAYRSVPRPSSPLRCQGIHQMPLRHLIILIVHARPPQHALGTKPIANSKRNARQFFENRPSSGTTQSTASRLTDPLHTQTNDKHPTRSKNTAASVAPSFSITLIRVQDLRKNLTSRCQKTPTSAHRKCSQDP